MCGTIGFGENPEPLAEITNSIGMKLRLIPAGEFVMGSQQSGPQHKVRITRPFYLGVYEVTQAEYEKVMGKNPGYFSKGGRGAGRVSGKDASLFPVEMVSWDDAVELCRKLDAGSFRFCDPDKKAPRGILGPFGRLAR
jgi:formylglycine-generating enzyme required for sulfatase activity